MNTTSICILSYLVYDIFIAIIYWDIIDREKFKDDMIYRKKIKNQTNHWHLSGFLLMLLLISVL